MAGARFRVPPSNAASVRRWVGALDPGREGNEFHSMARAAPLAGERSSFGSPAQLRCCVRPFLPLLLLGGFVRQLESGGAVKFLLVSVIGL